MKDFIHTGFHTPTLTTVDDPNLKVFEIDNGYTWTMKFYVNNTLIDIINMESPIGTEINNNVKRLPVYDEDDNIIGTIEDRLKEAMFHSNC